MKEVWKKLLGGGVLVLLAAALVLTGCSSDDDDDDDDRIEWTETRTYTGTGLSVTANPDRTCTATVGGNNYAGTFTGNLEADTSGTITVTIDKEYNFAYTVDSTGTTITVDLTPMDMSAVTLTRTDTTDSGDSGSSSDSSGTTDDTGDNTETEYVTLTLTFDGFTIPGGTVSVYYGADSGTYETVSATVASDGASATASLNKALANSYSYYNSVSITIKDSSGEVVSCSYVNYFQYDSTTATATLTLTFSGGEYTEIVSAQSVALTEGWSSYDEAVSASNMTAASGASAIKISVSGTTNKVCVYYGSGTWVADLESSNSFETTVTDATTISGLVTNGVYLCSGSAETVTITVSYKQ